MMAHGKLSLPQDLLPSPAIKPDEASEGNAGEKALTGSLDDSKDHLASESSIPLSPQWLHAKSVDATVKPLASGTSGEIHAPGSLSHGNSIDSNTRDVWRSDGSRDRKDWRRNAPDLDVNRRWREEERETGLLGRRDRKKEDRRVGVTSTRDITENRAEDHRAGGPSTRDVAENKILSSDRWHESRRDTKWSSRWGPEDKDKDSRIEKTDLEREDTLVSSNRAVPERDGDSRDKWRPRHRMEVQSGGPAPYRAAPGFGMARGQVEKVGFASGRGRSHTSGSVQIGRPSSATIGSVLDQNQSVLGKAGPFTEKYRYPRGKLLDIYRKQKIESTFDIVPEGMEHVPPITQVGCIEPLAFVAPDADEEAGMEDIWKGRITSSEVLCSQPREKNVLNDDGTSNASLRKEEDKKISSQSEENAPFTGEAILNNSFPVIGAEVSTICNLQTHTVNEGVEGGHKVSNGTAFADGSNLVAPKNYDCRSTGDIDGVSNIVDELRISGCQDVREFGLAKHSLSEYFEPANTVIGSLLPDSNSSFHIPSPQQALSSDHVKSDEKADLERVVSFEDLSLCYLDPQGNIQGPFLGIDIIQWFDQGFFGTDLLLRLTDAPDDTPFQELGDMMPNLKTQSGLVSNSNLPTNIESLDGVGSILEERKPASHYEESNNLDTQHWTSSGLEPTSSDNLHSRIRNSGYNSELQYNQRLQNYVEEDDVFPGRPKSSSDFPLRRPSADIQGSFLNSPNLPSLADEVCESNLPNRHDDKLHPFGLLMSELRGSSHLRPGQTSNVSLGMDDQAQFRDTMFEGGISKLNWLNNPNISMHQVVPDMEHLIELQRQEEQHRLLELQHKHKLEIQRQQQHELEFQQQRQLELQQQRHLELQQQRQLELHHLELQQQRQLEHQLQLQKQRQFELQQQRQLELQQQQQHRLELQQQQQRKLELQQLQRLQQQRQLEFQQQQQQRQLELQQQQCHLELQPQHQLEQHLRHYQKLQQQQQSQSEQVLLEQFLSRQMSDSYGQWKMDATRANLHDPLNPSDLHHVSHSSRHDPSLEQIIQATMGEGVLPVHTDFFDLISQAKQGNRNTSELPLRLNEQELQAQQISMALREQQQMEGERRIGVPWFADDAGPFVRDPAGHHQAHLLGHNSSENYLQQQMFPSNEQELSHRKWNRASQERPLGGFYEPNPSEFDRFPVPAGSYGMNVDIANIRGQDLDVREQYRLSSSIEERGSLSSGVPSHHRLVSDEFYASHQSLPSGNNGQLESSTETVMPYLHLDAEQKRRDTEATNAFSASNRWASANGDNEQNKQILMDLHQNFGHQPTQSSEVDYQHHLLSSRGQGGPVHLPFNVHPDQSVGMNNSFTEAPHNSNYSILLQEQLGSYERNEQPSNLARRSDSRAFMDPQFLSGTRDTPPEQRNTAIDSEELPSNAHSRHSSLSSAGGYGGFHSSEMGADKSLEEDVPDGRLPSTTAKGFDSGTSRCCVLSSQDVFPVKPKISTSLRTSEGNPAATMVSGSTATSKNHAQFRRTSSYSDAGVSETSFMDVLKKPVIPEADNRGAMESSDGGGQVGRTGKKKGKKGRQIDPALLGFKVSSNRIMKGEIHRLDD